MLIPLSLGALSLHLSRLSLPPSLHTLSPRCSLPLSRWLSLPPISPDTPSLWWHEGRRSVWCGDRGGTTPPSQATGRLLLPMSGSPWSMNPSVVSSGRPNPLMVSSGRPDPTRVSSGQSDLSAVTLRWLDLSTMNWHPDPSTTTSGWPDSLVASSGWPDPSTCSMVATPGDV